jgi:hypothetical protein
MKKGIPTFCVAAIIFAMSFGVELLAASFSSVSGIRVATGARDWNGNGVIDAFEDFNGNGTPDAFEDFNGNGTPDAFEDFNGNGIPDAFEDFNGNGIPDAFEDFNGNGTPDAFEDFNGNGIPDAFEDFNGNGIPDAFEDFNGNGVPDAFESKGSGVPFDVGSETFGAMGIAVWETSNPDAQVSGYKTYSGSSFRLDWSAFLAANPAAAGVIYRVDHDRDALLQIDSYDGYVDRNVSQGVTISLTNNACYYVHAAPIRSADASIDRANETVVRIMREARAPFLRSPTHTNQTMWFSAPNVNMEFIPFHIDGSSVQRFFFEWDQQPDTVPTTNSLFKVGYNQPFIFQPNGTYYFHVRAQDPSGVLSETAHYQVNIGEPIPMPPAPDFSADYSEGFAPLTVTFTDLSLGDIDRREWDFNGDGVINATNPPVVYYTYHDPGTYTVSLTATGPLGSETETKVDYITVHEPLANRPPVVAVAT